MLRVEQLHKSYPRHPRVLEGVSLALARGEIVGLSGRSGAGKSTLARCIAGIERTDAGRMQLDGEPLAFTRTRNQRRRIQYVWQEPQLALSPYGSALEAVMEPLQGFELLPRSERADRAAVWLARMGIDTSAMGRRPDALSGGQCQRVVLARALAAEPDVLLLDEPFSALDTVTTAALMRSLSQTLADLSLAVLLVSHDRVAMRRLATRHLGLDEGRLSASSD